MRHTRTRPGSLPAVAWITALLALTTLMTALPAAPAPMPRASRTNHLRPAHVVGTWTMQWNGIKGTLTLSPGGDYCCVWCGVKFVGTWEIDAEGRLRIKESHDPQRSGSWHGYTVRLDTATLSGQIETGSEPFEVRLEEPR
jgi:hypothetical protein